MRFQIIRYLKRDLLVHFILYTFSAGFLKLIGFLIFLYLAKSLSSESYAEFGLMYSIQVLISTFGVAGVVELIVSKIHLKGSEDTKVELYNLANTIFFILLALTSFIVFLIYLKKEWTEFQDYLLLIIVILNSIALTGSLYKTQIERLNENHGRSLIFSFLIPFISYASGFLFFFIKNSVFYFFFGSLLGSLLPLFFFTRFHFCFILPDRILMYTSLLSCAPFIASAFLNWISGYGINQIISIFLSHNAIARFTFLFSLASIMQLIASAMNQVWAPVFFKSIHSGDLDVIKKKNEHFFLLMVVVLTVIASLMFLVLPFIKNYFGENAKEYLENELFLFLIISSYVILPPYWQCQNYLLAYGKGLDLFKITAFSTVIGIVLTFILITFIGELGVYFGFFVVVFLKVIIIYLYSLKYWKLNLPFKGVFIGLFFLFILFLF
jgi:O-antigen/teichoic acid export membrane protein